MQETQPGPPKVLPEPGHYFAGDTEDATRHAGIVQAIEDADFTTRFLPRFCHHPPPGPRLSRGPMTSSAGWSSIHEAPREYWMLLLPGA
jgi:hypothetical protein